jgi:hypothetical protein
MTSKQKMHETASLKWNFLLLVYGKLRLRCGALHSKRALPGCFPGTTPDPPAAFGIADRNGRTQPADTPNRTETDLIDGKHTAG